jgi:hypothetical protein
MISGKFVDSRVILPVRFLLPGDMSFTIDFVVDTGFSGYLTLPASGEWEPVGFWGDGELWELVLVVDSGISRNTIDAQCRLSDNY